MGAKCQGGYTLHPNDVITDVSPSVRFVAQHEGNAFYSKLLMQESRVFPPHHQRTKNDRCDHADAERMVATIHEKDGNRYDRAAAERIVAAVHKKGGRFLKLIEEKPGQRFVICLETIESSVAYVLESIRFFRRNETNRLTHIEEHVDPTRRLEDSPSSASLVNKRFGSSNNSGCSQKLSGLSETVQDVGLGLASEPIGLSPYLKDAMMRNLVSRGKSWAPLSVPIGGGAPPSGSTPASHSNEAGADGGSGLGLIVDQGPMSRSIGAPSVHLSAKTAGSISYSINQLTAPIPSPRGEHGAPSKPSTQQIHSDEIKEDRVRIDRSSTGQKPLPRDEIHRAVATMSGSTAVFVAAKAQRRPAPKNPPEGKSEIPCATYLITSRLKAAPVPTEQLNAHPPVAVPPKINPNGASASSQLSSIDPDHEFQVLKIDASDQTQQMDSQSSDNADLLDLRRNITKEQIEESIPAEASSIFHMFDRRVNLDLHAPDASMYSLLRSWTQDDPYRRVPAPGSDLKEYPRVPSNKAGIAAETNVRGNQRLPCCDVVSQVQIEEGCEPSREVLLSCLVQKGRQLKRKRQVAFKARIVDDVENLKRKGIHLL
jgi:hypothetical protein